VEINASEFKAKSLALLDRVRAEGITVVIRKRGKIVAKLVAETDSRDEKPWLDLRGQSHFTGDRIRVIPAASLRRAGVSCIASCIC
jgi:antitoxin (DNA-binding transcriptional repressor) of toxin-antitoxin stability system